MKSTKGFMAEPLPELLKVGQVAAMCNCSCSHVRRMASDGRLPSAVRVGRLRRWPRHSIEQWLAAGCCPMRQR